jgi:protein-S-isoprenylcysteine O-methyltransferase Ste14
MAALLLYLLYLLVVFGGRALLLRRRTGSAGWHGISGSPGSAAWWGGVLFAVALLGGLAGAAVGSAEPAPPALELVGLALYGLGFAGSLAAQRAMGEAWRVGVAKGERTELVASGVFRFARNPFFSALTVTAAGLTLLVANALALASLVALILAVELQVRVVEEPYLARTHGDAYRAYASRVGRFVPWAGRA